MEYASITISTTKPPFKEAMKRARAICEGVGGAPLTQPELFRVFRSCKDGGNVILRCTISGATAHHSTPGTTGASPSLRAFV
jgi:hypothetical protein